MTQPRPLSRSKLKSTSNTWWDQYRKTPTPELRNPYQNHRHTGRWQWYTHCVTGTRRGMKWNVWTAMYHLIMGGQWILTSQWLGENLKKRLWGQVWSNNWFNSRTRPSSSIGWITTSSLVPRVVLLFTLSEKFWYSTSTWRILPSRLTLRSDITPYWYCLSNSFSDLRNSTTSPILGSRSESNHLGWNIRLGT